MKEVRSVSPRNKRIVEDYYARTQSRRGTLLRTQRMEQTISPTLHGRTRRILRVARSLNPPDPSVPRFLSPAPAPLAPLPRLGSKAKASPLLHLRRERLCNSNERPSLFPFILVPVLGESRVRRQFAYETPRCAH
ncbi:hypothetical protein PUN28_003845 [Cardiocondyla obscurior]|uniref:Ribosomal protein S14 n=1 Tax=Cardiocondyla obscurior TaxID=286306 RepID=A0AAW2GMI6_9HYME